MNVVTNGTIAIPIIPECRATSIQQWASNNGFEFTNTADRSLDYYIPYRDAHGRIVRGLAADLHELMLNAGVANLNKSKWDEVKDDAILYILNWIDTKCIIPIEKKFCHSGHYCLYLGNNLVFDNAIFFNIDSIQQLPITLNNKYNLNLTTVIPDLPENFYDHTVPYWVIEELYVINKKLKDAINCFIKADNQITAKISITQL